MRYVSKKFLSPCAYESGSIIAFVETPLVKDIHDYTIRNPQISASLTLRACYGEPIKFEFDVSKSEGGGDTLQKRLDKIDMLLDEITKFRSQVENGWNNHIRNVEFRKEQLKSGG